MLSKSHHPILNWMVVMPTFLAAFFLMMYMTFLLVWPPKIITDVQFTELQSSVRAGEMYRYKVHMKKNVDTATEIHYALRGTNGDHEYFDAGAEWGSNPKGEFTIVQHVHIPEDIPPGEYELVVVAIMRANKIRSVRYQMKIADITVLPGG